MSNNGMYWLGVILITIGLSVVFTRKDNQKFDHTMNVSGPVVMNVRTSSGDIDVTKSNNNEIEIRTDVRVRSLVPFEAGRITRRIKRNPPIEQNGNEVTIGDMSKYRFGRFGGGFFRSISIDYAIETPYDTELNLRSSSGEQSVKDIAGPINAQASSGNIDLKNILEDIKAELSSGDLTIKEVDGSVELKLSSGNIQLADISGNVTSKQSSGNTTIKDSAGALNITTTSGNINLDSDVPENATWRFQVTSGDVALDVPTDTVFNLDATMTSGEIDFGSFDFMGENSSRKATGTVGLGSTSKNVTIDTTSGDIRFN